MQVACAGCPPGPEELRQKRGRSVLGATGGTHWSVRGPTLCQSELPQESGVGCGSRLGSHLSQRDSSKGHIPQGGQGARPWHLQE